MFIFTIFFFSVILLNNVISENIFDLTIPGTHDSGAYNLTSNIIVCNEHTEYVKNIVTILKFININIENIILPWSICHNRTIGEQISDGIRYIDLRAVYDIITNEWYVHHSFIGDTIENIFKEIYNSVTNEKVNSVYILDINICGNIGNISKFNNILYFIEKYIWYVNKPYINQSLDILLKNSSKIILTTTDSILLKDMSDKIWNSSILMFSTRPETSNIKDMFNTNIKNIDIYKKEFKDKQQLLYKVTWTLTPDFHTFLNMVIDKKKSQNLKELVDIANNKLVETSNFILQTRPSNIFIIDFYNSINFIDLLSIFKFKYYNNSYKKKNEFKETFLFKT